MEIYRHRDTDIKTKKETETEPAGHTVILIT